MSLEPSHVVVERVLEAAGGAPCVVLVEDSDEAEVRFANNTTTTNGRRLDRRVVVIRFWEVGGGIAAGVASRSGEADPAQMVAAAEADARSSPPSPDAAPLLGGDADRDFEVPSEPGDPGSMAAVLEGLAGAFERAESRRSVLSGFLEYEATTCHLGTSTGIRLRHGQPLATLQMVGRSDDGRRSAWVAEAAAAPGALDVGAMEATLTERLGWAETTIELPAGRYEVILPPSAVADLMIDLASAAAGQDAEEGRTVFSAPGGGTRVGERLSELPFRLFGDPGAPGLECIPFLAVGASSGEASVYDNGARLEATDWISAGRLANLRYHRAGAARSGTRFAPPVDNLLLELPGAEGTVEDLLARTERGLLLTCLWYIREVDPSTLLLTGLTRDGVYLVEDGEVVGAVNNFRFNESPVDLLARTIEAGASGRTLGREFGEWARRTAMPALRVDGFNMSSTSEAS